ncbi:sulfite exporter TauE/SafE family protein [Notoacmeibacter sp. MSK16QG-6]|uniref:sulfite exporter TauE/SafE family protein n=1 Tax=Notoacmeibacter sp. MSK16QG-6 TaxID=2957982 RepID=UPI0020A05AB9|nr:sulfite exporter TauE/SafE family protein [Notoacmeibacter sp. MSK16QG-6]MCP1199496.1 sulfite exporter TauE/SafE family protein [Notoacmeibacter sp. MSK16QG-6]
MTPELIGFGVLAIVSGALAGFLAGLFGIGGGAVLVPVLDQMLTFADVGQSIRMHLAVGTSLAVIVATSLRSYLSHRAYGQMNDGLLGIFLFAVPAGAIFASAITASISGDTLRAIFATISVFIAIRLLFDRVTFSLGQDLPGKAGRSVVGFFIGLLSALMGIGGGVLTNTFMTLYNRPMKEAVSTSAAVGVLIAVPGLFGYIWAGWDAEGLPPFSLGFVNGMAVAIFVPVTLLMAPVGVAMAHRLPERSMRIGFGLFLLVVAARFFYSLV